MDQIESRMIFLNITTIRNIAVSAKPRDRRPPIKAVYDRDHEHLEKRIASSK